MMDGAGPARVAALMDKVLASAPVHPDPPCRWSVERSRIELRSPGVDAVDLDRPTVISAGEALLAVRVVARSFGALCSVTVLPDGHRPDLLAVLRIDGFAVASDLDVALARGLAGPAGSTGERPHRPDILTHLRSAARREQAWLAVLPTPAAFPTRAPRSAEECAGQDLVVGTTLDVPAAWMRAGQAVRRIVATAAVAGLDLRPGTPPSMPGDERAAIRARLGGGIWPQALLRCR